ncbi:MAG: hypothetical protein RLZZ338_1828 [Cyanobacteriota bacterium]
MGVDGAFVGALSPDFLLPTNNPNKPALTQGLNGINSPFVGGEGAGFLACLFDGTDIGEPAPTVVQILTIRPLLMQLISNSWVWMARL